tara:strand:- start:1875 stop:2507 length:633 start_codon:yes stop_codon:yes gene_type:complete
MKITKRKVAELVEDANNARAHDTRNLQAIEKSLQEFGQQKPIVITKGNKVIAGNGTLLAAIQLGWEEIDVVTTTLTKAKQAGFAIADNRTGELSAWDTELLASTLAELSDNGVPMESIGYTQIEIDNMLASLDGLNVEVIETSEFPNGFKRSKEDYESSAIKNIQMFFHISMYAQVVAALEQEKVKRKLESYPEVLTALLVDAGYEVKGD